jgi:hypothetical protein
MSTPQVPVLSPVEQEQFAAVVERLRQFRRRAGVPDGVTLEEAVALHIISVQEVERARWGPLAPPATAPIAVVPSRSELEP